MKSKNIISGVAAVAILAVSAMPAVNVGAVRIGTDGTGATGNVKTIPLTREVENVTNKVNNTFTYTITPESSNPAGGASDVPTSTTVVFNNVEPSGSKATASGVIDFAGAEFTKLGDYYYTVEETGSTDTTNFPLSTKTYKAMLSVRNVLSGGVPTGDLEVTFVQLMDDGGTKKEAVFTSNASRTYFEVTGNVTGNMSEKDQCFKYKVNVPVQTGVVSGDTYSLNKSSLSCAGNPDNITAGADNFIYLKHGETATIGGTGEVPIGVSYTVAKVNDTDNGYTTKVDGENGTETIKTTVAQNDPDFNEKKKTTFTNDKEQDPLTGIVTNVWVWVVILALGTLGVVYTVRKKKSDNEA